MPTAVGFHRLRVQAVDQLTADSVALTLQVPTDLAELFRFRPGQHLTLRHEAGEQDLRRTYSVCSSAEGGPLRIGVKRLEGGAFSTWANEQLQVGDELEVLPPAGSFGPRVEASRSIRYGLVAAGSGITPVLSIAATVLDVEPGSDVVLLFGNRTTRDVMFLEEISDLKDRFPERLQVLHVMSREEQESDLLTGRLDRQRLKRLLTDVVPVASVDEWYLCGPFGMVTEGRQVLLDAGAPPGTVHVELFHADAPPPRPPREKGQPTGSATVVAELHGRRTTVAVERHGESVLEALLAVRPDAPYACKGGVCGTCRARVTAGTVEMVVNYALEPDELARGVVLTCQSHPTSDDVRLEFM